MKIQQKPSFDPETDRFRFEFREPLSSADEILYKLFSNWMQRRESEQICTCFVKHLSVEARKDRRRVDVICGWFCDQCLPMLEADISTELPTVVKVIVGANLSAYPKPDLSFVDVDATTVEFECGARIEVLPFRIYRSAVTIGQFDAFTRATGYRTSYEITGKGSFRLDETIEPIRPKDRTHMSVHNVSFRDAVAYCQWSGQRLPTEAEWLAAALVDRRVMDRREAHRFLFGNNARCDLTRFPGALLDLGPEWVVGDASPGHAIVRTGPQYVRKIGWENEKNRHESSETAYDLMTGFRVCEES